jgi:hypothetical protein
MLSVVGGRAVTSSLKIAFLDTVRNVLGPGKAYVAKAIWQGRLRL